MKHTVHLASAAALLALTLPAACATPSDKAPAAVTMQAPAAITEADVIAAQNAWGDALVTIATTYDTKGFEEARKVAEDIIEAAYNYENGPVLSSRRWPRRRQRSGQRQRAPSPISSARMTTSRATPALPSRAGAATASRMPRSILTATPPSRWAMCT